MHHCKGLRTSFMGKEDKLELQLVYNLNRFRKNKTVFYNFKEKVQ